jgi:sugar/nucleoside kinase (ribokinase family)
VQFPFTLAADKEFDVLGFGTNAVDHLIVVPEYPEFDSKVHLTRHIQAAGGQIASSMAGLSRLGFKAAYAGRFGSDAEGEFGLKTLADEGVDTRFSETIEGARTQIAFILIDEQSGERTVIWHRDAKLSYEADEAPLEAAGSAKILHLDAHDPLAGARMAKAARGHGAIVTVDVDNVYEGVTEMLPLIDIMISSAEFPARVTGIRDHRAALTEIKTRYGCPVVGMTLGEQGALILADDVFIESPSFAVPGGCKDTTGAGDAFRVGIIYGLLKGARVEESLKFANAVAALKCRQLGARTALPDEAELMAFIGS